MTDASLAHYYGDTFGGERFRLSHKINAGINFRVIARMVDLGKVGRALDVGTGYGYLPALLRDQANVRAFGVELSKREAAHARDTLGIEVHNGPLAEAPFERESFDLVTTFEVIEHVLDPVAFVRQLAERCRPGGHVLLGTDNFDAWVVHRLGPEFPKWIPHAHVSHLTPQTLRRCIESVDQLTIVDELSYTPWELLARVAWTRRVKSARDAFDLKQMMAFEFSRDSDPLYVPRWIGRRAWFALTARPHSRGAMFWVLTRKAAH